MKSLFCSTIIPTIGRPSLRRAVHSVLAQQLNSADFEVIVVNDSGFPLPEADWQSDPRVDIIDTFQRERSVARNVGASIAKGAYLHFLDDDDWLLPDALAQMHIFSQQWPHADWLLGGTQLVNRDGKSLLQLRHQQQGDLFLPTMAGEWLPLQSSFVKTSAFWSVGGFHPLIPGREDIDLARRMTLQSKVAVLPAVCAVVVMGARGSTTQSVQATILARGAREEILRQPQVAQRLWAGGTDRSWRARVVRIYLTSAVWNGRRRQFWTAFGRLFTAAKMLVRSGGGLLAPDYWRTVAHAYESETFARGAAAERV